MTKKLYKLRAKEHTIAFDSPPEWDMIEDVDENSKILYCTYDNCIELSEKAESEWRVIVGITWCDELIQVKLGFEYDVQYMFARQEHIDEVANKQLLEEHKLEWHKRFNSWMKKEDD